MRTLRIAIVATTLVTAGSALNAVAETRGPGAGWRDHHGGIVRDVKALIRRVEDRFSVPGGKRKALSVAACESSFHPNEDYGRYSGIYQIGDWEWHHWRRPHHYGGWFRGRPGPHNARANVITALFHARHGWKAWACA